MIPEVGEAILDLAAKECQRLFDKARRTSLTWEEEWSLVYFKSTMAAELQAGGNHELAQYYKVNASARSAKDSEVQADLGFTGCHLVSGDLITTQKVDSMQAAVQTDGGPSKRTLGRRLRKKRVEGRWKQQPGDQA